MRICSLLPSATEIVFALGLGDYVTGVTHECDHPPEARKKPVVVNSKIDPDKIGSGDIDQIIAQSLETKESVYSLDFSRFQEANPDLILTQELCDVCAVDYNEVLKAVQALAHKPKIISLNPSLLTDVLRDVERVGEATGRESGAKALVAELRARIDRVREKALGADARPRVACLEWLDPIYNSGHWIPEMVELAGGMDGLGEKGKPSRKIAWKDVVEFAPEIIVLMPCGFDIERTLKEVDLLCRLPQWQQLPAVRHRKVFAVNGHAYFSRSGPRLIDGLEILAQIIHPEIFPWKTPPEAARRLG